MAEGGLPTGTITFVFTDLEGSTHLLQRLGDRYPGLLAMHYELMRVAFGRHHGREVGTRGDALFVVFEQASDAVAGAVQAQLALAGYDWPDDCDVRVRMGVHTGEAKLTDGDYVGVAVHATARICSAAHGGQVLLSDVARAIAEPVVEAGTTFVGVGRHRLKDLAEPLSPKTLLLILDNCEHVLTAGAELIALLLQACRNLQVMATSQEALGIPGEVVLRVPPMAPAEGVELFSDRAKLRNRQFHLGADNRAVITDL